jgi:pyruvate formate lyase activating enzyme
VKEARFYKTLDHEQVVCELCPHQCKLSDGKIGVCGVRQNLKGVLYSLVFEQPVAMHVDPIEKKPFFHVFPGSTSYSVATVGCNFHCHFCQNHNISQVRGKPLSGDSLSARQIVQAAQDNGCKTIACTYTEPTVYYEFAFEIARIANENGLATVWVTNGYINEAPLAEIAPFLAAANVDLKGWNEAFYRKVVGGDLRSVLRSLKQMKTMGVWVEVTTLLVPDQISDQDLAAMALFIKEELGEETPWHISRFYPQFEYTHVPATPVSLLQRAREIGLQVGLRYVYSGNVPGDKGEHTYCPHCGKLVIERFGFQILAYHLQNSRCSFCNAGLDGVGL